MTDKGGDEFALTQIPELHRVKLDHEEIRVRQYKNDSTIFIIPKYLRIISLYPRQPSDLFQFNGLLQQPSGSTIASLQLTFLSHMSSLKSVKTARPTPLLSVRKTQKLSMYMYLVSFF
jgi:hypothetical protein